MAKRPKRQNTQFREGVGATKEWADKADVEIIEAPRIVGHDGGNVRTQRRVHPCDAWKRAGWLTEEGAAKLKWWDELRLTANYDRARSCLDDTPRGSGGGARPERMIDAGRLHAQIKLDLCEDMGAHSVRCLVHFLSAEGSLQAAYREAFEPLRNCDCYDRARRIVVRAGQLMELYRR